MALWERSVCGGDSMIDDKRIEYKTYRLTCLSPIHVGNGQVLKQSEYYYDSRKHKAYFLNPTKWAHFLVENHLLDEYARDIMNGQVKAIWPWLRNCGKNREFERTLHELAVAAAPVYMSDVVNGKKQNLNELQVQVKTAHGVPYIPGSSIKGAIRTAILYHLIITEPRKYAGVWRDLCENLIRKNKRYSNKELEKKAFSVIPEPEGAQHRMNDSLKSVMRGIKVSDAMSDSGTLQTVIIDKKDVSKTVDKGIGKEHPIPVFRECIAPGSILRFTVAMDKDMLKPIGLSSLDQLWQWVRSYTQIAVSLEYRAFRNCRFQPVLDEAKQADVFLGAGTGFLTKTVLHAFQSGKENQKLLAAYFDKAFMAKNKRTHQKEAAHHHVQRDDDITPRTLKLAFTADEVYRMGMATIREIRP